jgi:TolA-binding protein
MLRTGTFALLLLLCAPLFAGAEEDYSALLKAFNDKQYAQSLPLAEAFVVAHADHKYAGAACYMGGVSGRISGEHARAEVMYRKLLKDYPENRHAAKARNELVTVLDALRKLKPCIEQCEDNLKALPADANAERWTFMIAQSRFRLWEFAQAEKDLKAFVKAHPKSANRANADYYLERINPPLKLDKNGVVQGYAGKFKDDVRFQSALKHLPDYVTEAWRVLKRTLGVDLKGAQVVFEFQDKGFKRDTNRAITETICVDYKPFTRMVFYTEHIVVSEADFRSRVIHELKHAAFRDVMGQAYLDLPKWVREGLAVLGAEQFDDRLCAILGGYEFSGRTPRDVLDGIDDVDHDEDDYLEDAAAFLWLNTRRKNGVHEYCARLLKGESHETLFAELSGLEFRKALDGAAGYARKLVDERLGEAAKQFEAIRRDEARQGGNVNTWLKDTGIARYQAWLKANPAHAYTPNARYRIGKSMVLTGQHEAGRAMLRQVIELDQLTSSICDDALFWIATSYADSGDSENAAATWGELLRDYSWSRPAIENQRKYAIAGPVTAPGKE